MKKTIKTCTNWVKDQDEIVTPSAANLHFQTDFKQKTVLGGVASLGVTLYVLFMVYSQGKKLIYKENNTYVSLSSQMKYDDVGTQPIADMSKPMLEFLEGGDNTVEITHADQQYINMRLINMIKTFKDGAWSVNPVSYKMKKCDESDFQRNEFDKKYWAYADGNRVQYCPVDPENKVYMQGTRDSYLLEQDHAYILFEVTKCNDDHIYKDAAITCALPADIDTWISTKVVAMKLLNQKIDFYEFGHTAVRYNEVFIPGVPMNKYSDTGYRFRYNEFDRQDGPYVQVIDKDTFFDFLFYSSDSYPTPPSTPASAQYLIAEMYFRLEVDQISHTRHVYALMDFIGALGGVSDLLLQILGWIFGGYAAFHSGFATLSALYKVKSNDTSIFLPSKKNSTEEPNIAKIKIALGTRVALYFFQSPLGCFCRPCRKPVHERYLQLLEAGGERKEEEFDVAHMITTLRDLRHEVDLLREKTNTTEDPAFTRNPKNLLDLDTLADEDDEKEPNLADSKNDNEKQSTDAIPLVAAAKSMNQVDVAPQIESNSVSPEIADPKIEE